MNDRLARAPQPLNATERAILDALEYGPMRTDMLKERIRSGPVMASVEALISAGALKWSPWPWVARRRAP